MKLKRTPNEDKRERCEMRDPSWCLYKTEGPTLDEILSIKPPKIDPDKAQVWTKAKGWIEVKPERMHANKVPRD